MLFRKESSWHRSIRIPQVAHVVAHLAVILAFAGTAHAQYLQRANSTTAGAVTFTGNALGLDSVPDGNGQGTRGAIGTFITTDLTQQDLSPAPGTAPPFPAGTTSAWQLNRSEAMLRLPFGARVLHAELIWGGTFAGTSAADNVSAFLDDPVLFTTAAGATTGVTPDPATARSSGTPAGTGTCQSCFYVRTADVTALVAAAGAGTYAVGRVPATQGVTDNNNPVAGWTLAVVYEDFTLPIRNLTLFLGLEKSGGAAAQVVGFCTPPTGTLAGRLAVTALEGDARTTGDQLLFGPTAALTAANRVSGARNPPTNFFSSQITDDQGSLDTSGTFGDHNHTPGTPSVGGRQGWDITNVDASAQIQNNQTTAFAQGTTSGDGYTITALGLQIDIGAPRFRNANTKTVDLATAVIGDVLTYTVTLDNSGGTAAADNVVFFDTPPPGTSFVGGSLTVDGVAQPGADPLAGVPLGAIAAGAAVTVTLQVRVDSIPAGLLPEVRANRARWTFDYVSCAGQGVQPGAAESNTVVTIVPTADLSIAKTFDNAPAIAGAPVTYRLRVRNHGPSSVDGAVLTDPGSSPSLTGVTWTCIASTNAACSPASGTGPVSTALTLPRDGDVQIVVTGTLPANTPAGTLNNTAVVTAPPGVPDAVPGNNAATSSVPIALSADIRVTKTGPATAVAGTNVTYTVSVTNLGPSDAQGVVVTDPAPPGLTVVTPLTGTCSTACTLPAGTTQTLTATFAIPAAYTTPDPIVNTASATSATSDPNTSNNTGIDRTALNSPVADISITKTNNTASVVPGGTTTYTITVSNAGPAAAIGTRVVDTFPPGTFAAVQWQCAASGTSACAVTGPQSGNIDTLIDVQPGIANTVVFTATANLQPGATGNVTNVAVATTSASVTDPDTANNTATDIDSTTATADVSVINSGPATVAPGTTVQYPIVVTNSGPSTALNIPVATQAYQDTGLERPDLIAGLDAPAGIVCEPVPFFSPVTLIEFLLPQCTIPALAPGESINLVARLTIPPDYPASTDPANPNAIASLVFIPGVLPVPDPDDDDHASFAFSALTPLVDLAISKVGPASIVAGSTVSYFIELQNRGPSAATNVVIEDPTPAGLSFVGADGACITGFPCTIPVVAAGASISIRIDLLVPFDYQGPRTFVNSAATRADQPDPDAANNSATVSTLVVPEQADLLVQTSGPAVVSPGGQIEYTARVINLGPGPARDVTWSDVLPGGTVFVSGVGPGAPSICSPPTAPSNLGSCLTPLLAVGAAVEFRFTVQASPTLLPGSVLTNVVVVTSPTADLNLLNNRAELSTKVAAAAEADLEVTQTDILDPVVAGTDVTYSIAVRNNGPAAASNINLVDALPAGLTLVSTVATQGSCTAATCALGGLTAGATATVTVVATTSTTGLVVNTASASAAELDPVASNNTASETTTVANAADADLAIIKVGPRVVAPGDATSYAIAVTNRGPATALAIQVTDPLPAGVTFIGNSDGCVTAFPCEIEMLAAGETRIIRTTVIIDPGVVAPALVINAAQVTSSQTPDPNPANNSSSLTTLVNDGVSADLVVVKTDSPDPVGAGTPLTYVVTVANLGPALATAVTLADTLPAGVTLLSTRATVGSCSGTTTVTCTLGDLAKGSVVQIEIRTTAPSAVPAPNPMINTATVTSGTPDPNASTNTATAATTVVALADVRVSKTGPAAATAGTSVSYDITIANDGPSSATGVSLADPIPAGLTLSSVGGACTTLPCALGTMAPGEARTVQVTLQIPVGYGGANPILNQATVASASDDPDLTNNVAQASTAVSAAVTDLSISVIGPARVVRGRAATYSVTVTNAGPATATGVAIEDPAPAGLIVGAVTGACTTLPCGLGSLASGETRTFTVTLTVPRTFVGASPIVNRATVTSTTSDSVPANNTAAAATIVAPPTVCDVNGDGTDEFVTGAGPGGGPHVQVWSVTNGAVTNLASFFAYDPAFGGGAFVACGDVDGDGFADVVTGAGEGGGPHVRAFSFTTGAATEIASFFAYDPAFTGGVRVATGDVDGDGVVDIITGAGPGGGPHVRAFSLAAGAPSEVASFFAYASGFPGGVFVAGGDVNGDGRAEIITATYREGGPVRVFDVTTSGATEMAAFYAYFDRFLGPTHVGTADLNGDGVAEILTGAGPDGGPHVRALTMSTGTLTELASFYAYAPSLCDFGVLFPGTQVCDGVYVAGADVDGDGRAEIVTATNRLGGPLKIFKIEGGLAEVSSFYPYYELFLGPVYVAGIEPDRRGTPPPLLAPHRPVVSARNFLTPEGMARKYLENVHKRNHSSVTRQTVGPPLLGGPIGEA